MSKNLLFLCCFFVFTVSYSQKELWGYRTVYNYLTPGTPGINDGEIVKISLDESSHNPEIMHVFDVTGLAGKFPRGRLFQASNGKLYGLTGYEGSPVGQGIPKGVLFEYDLVLNRYKVLSTVLNNASWGVIEPLPGLLYGITNGGNSIFKYNINTEELNIIASIPPFLYNNSNYYPSLNNELMKASDGNLYATAPMAPSSQNIPYPGGIYKLNLATNQISKLYVFGTDLNADVREPVNGSKFVEGSPGKLYATALGGQHIGPQGVAPSGSGTLYEYTIATNTVVKKFDFDYSTIGCYPTPLIKNGNKLYGALTGLTNNTHNHPNAAGSIFEYDLATESLTVLHAFVPSNDQGVQFPYGFPLKASDGNIYGSNALGVYKYDPVTQTVIRKITAVSTFDTKDFIEVCRKPSYQFFETAAFTICKNSPFVFDVQNTNALTYVWRKGSTVLPAQTTGVLNINNLSLADTGIYTCTMTNDCGTTTTMPLQLTVENCLGLDESIGFKKVIELYPNPASDVINLKFPDLLQTEIKQLSISNMLGQKVYSNTEKTTTIDISFLKTGMYQLTLSTANGEWNARFLKQ